MAGLKIHNTDIRAIIFDFDGTLARLNIDFGQMREAVTELISSYDIESNQLLNGFILEMVREAKSLISKYSKHKADIFFRSSHQLIEAIEMEAAAQGELFPTTRKLLQTLRASNIACGIITRNCRAAICKTFPDITDYSEAVICRDNVDYVKPHPEHINKALEILAIPAKNTLMIGDHPLDITTGKNAGTFTAGVLTGNYRENDFFQAGADLVLKAAPDVLHLINI